MKLIDKEIEVISDNVKWFLKRFNLCYLGIDLREFKKKKGYIEWYGDHPNRKIKTIELPIKKEDK